MRILSDWPVMLLLSTSALRHLTTLKSDFKEGRQALPNVVSARSRLWTHCYSALVHLIY